MRFSKKSALQIALYWLGSDLERVKRHPKAEYFCVFTQPRPVEVLCFINRLSALQVRADLVGTMDSLRVKGFAAEWKEGKTRPIAHAPLKENF